MFSFQSDHDRTRQISSRRVSFRWGKDEDEDEVEEQDRSRSGSSRRNDSHAVCRKGTVSIRMERTEVSQHDVECSMSKCEYGSMVVW